jgi:hypothetical protein
MSARPWADHGWRPITASRYPTLRSAIHLSAEDAIRMALGAFYAAVRDMNPPDGQKWLGPDPELDPCPWSSPQDLHDGILHHRGERLWRHAIEAGHVIELAPYSDIDDPATPGAGAEPLRSAATDGCASAPGACPPASAVGPAPTGSNDADITVNADPLLAVRGMQRLPGETSRDTFDPSGEKLP